MTLPQTNKQTNRQTNKLTNQQKSEAAEMAQQLRAEFGSQHPQSIISFLECAVLSLASIGTIAQGTPTYWQVKYPFT